MTPVEDFNDDDQAFESPFFLSFLGFSPPISLRFFLSKRMPRVRMVRMISLRYSFHIIMNV